MINFLSIVACILGMYGSYLCAKGYWKSVYVISIINGFIFVALNGLIAVSSSEQTGVALMIIPSVWMILTSIYGLFRLESENP